MWAVGAGVWAPALPLPVPAVVGRGPWAAPKLTAAIGAKAWKGGSLQLEAVPTPPCSFLAPEIPVLV